MGALSAAAPPLAVRLAQRLFVTPPRRRLSPTEAAWADEASPLSLRTPAGTVRAWRWGDGAPTVLLLHGWGGRGPQLGGVARALVDRGYSAVAWDMPGHGERPSPTNVLEMAEATDAVARSFGDVAGVVAHSFGTATALVATARHGMHVPRLAAVAPAALVTRVTGRFGELTGFSEAVVQRMRGRLSDRLGFDWRELEAAQIAPGLDCPALLIHDRDDERIPHADGAELARLLPGAELVTTTGLGHSGGLRDAGVLAAIAAFHPEPAGAS